MNKRIIPTVAFAICLTIGVSVVSTDASALEDKDVTAMDAPTHKVAALNTSREFNFEDHCAYWLKHGYSSMLEYNEAMEEMNAEAEGIADAAVKRYISVLEKDQIANLHWYEDKMVSADYIEVYDKYKELFDEIIADCEDKMPVQKVSYSNSSSGSSSSKSYYGNSSGGGLTKSQGVNYYGGRRETWYSSRVLHHYRTSEWTPDANGVYRDKDGYVVVAASDLAQGSTVQTSHGTGKVYDSGCAAGTTDIYVNW